MEEGSLRCDANVSVRKKGTSAFGTKTEVKNMNSFRFVERAIEFEIHRQIELLESGGRVVQETLLWDSAQGVAVAMRSKEEAHDYRYFPEPDLVPVVVDEAWIERSGASLPEFPEVRRDRYLTDFRLPRYDADILTAEKELADYFESVVAGLSKKSDETVKLASNWTMTEVLRVVNDRHIDLADLAVKPDHLAGMINLIVDGTISGKIAKEVFEEMLSSGERASVVVQRKGLVQISDTGAIEKTVDEVLAANPGEVEKFRAGKQQVFGFFVGEVMKRMKGKANPKVVNEILQKKLG